MRRHAVANRGIHADRPSKPQRTWFERTAGEVENVRPQIACGFRGLAASSVVSPVSAETSHKPRRVRSRSILVVTCFLCSKYFINGQGKSVTS